MNDLHEWEQDFKARMEAIDDEARRKKLMADAGWIFGVVLAMILWMTASLQGWIVVEPEALYAIVTFIVGLVGAILGWIGVLFVWRRL